MIYLAQGIISSYAIVCGCFAFAIFNANFLISEYNYIKILHILKLYLPYIYLIYKT